jgi:hypothetical protein
LIEGWPRRAAQPFWGKILFRKRRKERNAVLIAGGNPSRLSALRSNADFYNHQYGIGIYSGSGAGINGFQFN